MINVIAMAVMRLHEEGVIVDLGSVYSRIVQDFDLKLDWVLVSIVLDKHFR